MFADPYLLHKILLCNLHDELVLFVRARRQRVDRHRYHVRRVHFEMLHLRREWLRGARSDTNPTHIPPSVVAHRATTLTTFVDVSVRKIYLHPATVMAALQLI
jgi:hypothetical protein